MYHSPAAGQLQTRTPVLLVFITLFLSLAVEFAPLPAFIAPVKPLFPLLAVVYWGGASAAGCRLRRRRADWHHH